MGDVLADTLGTPAPPQANTSLNDCPVLGREFRAPIRETLAERPFP